MSYPSPGEGCWLWSDSPTWNLDTHCTVQYRQIAKTKNNFRRLSFEWTSGNVILNPSLWKKSHSHIQQSSKCWWRCKTCHACSELIEGRSGLDRDRDTSSGLIPVRGLSALFLTSFRPFCEKLTPWSTSHQQRQWSPTKHIPWSLNDFNAIGFPHSAQTCRWTLGIRGRIGWVCENCKASPQSRRLFTVQVIFWFPSCQAAGDNQAIRHVAKMFFEAELLTRVFFITILHDTNLA